MLMKENSALHGVVHCNCLKHDDVHQLEQNPITVRTTVAQGEEQFDAEDN